MNTFLEFAGLMGRGLLLVAFAGSLVMLPTVVAVLVAGRGDLAVATGIFGSTIVAVSIGADVVEAIDMFLDEAVEFLDLI